MTTNILEAYLKRKDSSFQIENLSNFTNGNLFFDNVHELGGDLKNGTLERVEKVSKNAIEIFEKTFGKSNQKIYILIYEFAEPNAFGAKNEFLHQQFAGSIKKYENKMADFDVVVYETEIRNIKYKTILRAIANTEMGFKPAIDQRIYFFDIENDKAFFMYDDRGCRTNGS